MTHSPLPWRIELDANERDCESIADANGEFILYSETYAEDIRLAVSSVNAHAELARVLEVAISFFERDFSGYESSWVEPAKAAIKLARGEA